MMVTSRRTMRETDYSGDVRLVPPTVEGMGTMDWQLGRLQEEAGYRYMSALLEREGGLAALFASGAVEIVAPGQDEACAEPD